jgi:ribose transport system substrate-binding protein
MAGAAATAAGCGSDAAEEPAAAKSSDEPVRIGYFMPAFSNTWYKAYFEGIEETAKKLGGTAEPFDAGFDAQKQYNQVQDALTAGKLDALIVTPVDGPGLAPLIEDAAEAKVPVVAVGTPLGTDYTTPDPQYPGVVGSVLTPAATDGVTGAKLIVEACGDRDPCNVVYILGQKAYGFDAARLKAMQDTLKANPNVKIVQIAEGGFLADPALKAMKDILQAHSDLHVVHSSGDQMVVGAEQAIKDAGREDEIVLIGTAGSKLSAEAIKAGRWQASTVYLPQTGGRLGAEMAIKAVRGEPIEDAGISEVDLSPIGPILNKDNVDEFKPEWLG